MMNYSKVTIIRVFYLVLITLIISINCNENVYGTQNQDNSELINSQIESLELDNVNQFLEIHDDSLSLSDLLIKAINGEINLSPSVIIKNGISHFLYEFKALSTLIKTLIIVAVLSGLIKNISNSFAQKSVHEICFYANYILVIILLLSAFRICVDIVIKYTDTICELINLSLPSMFTIMALSGKIISSLMFNSIILFFINLVSILIKNFISPLIILGSAICLLNYLKEEPLLTKMVNVIKKIISWSLKITIGLFISLLTIQGVSAPIMSNFTTKTTKAAINIVPVVGQALSSAVDAVFYISQGVKSGYMIAIIIIIIIICSTTIIKLFAYFVVFKFSAVLLEPICEKRIVNAIDDTSEFIGILIGTCSLITFMFIIMVIILLGVV